MEDDTDWGVGVGEGWVVYENLKISGYFLRLDDSH